MRVCACVCVCYVKYVKVHYSVSIAHSCRSCSPYLSLRRKAGELIEKFNSAGVVAGRCRGRAVTRFVVVIENGLPRCQEWWVCDLQMSKG